MIRYTYSAPLYRTFNVFWFEWPGTLERNDEGIVPALSQRERRCPFIIASRVISLSRSDWNNFIAASAHPENSEWYSIISSNAFEVNNVAEQKQAYL